MDECGEVASPASVEEQGARDGEVRDDPSSRHRGTVFFRQLQTHLFKGPIEYCRIQRVNLHYFLNLFKALFKSPAIVSKYCVKGVYR